MTTTTLRQFIGLFTEYGLDQICETTAEAARETRDLRSMGCTVNRYIATSEEALDQIDEWIRDGVPFATARNRVEAGQSLEGFGQSLADMVKNGPIDGPRSLSAAATPAELKEGYSRPYAVALVHESGRPGQTTVDAESEAEAMAKADSEYGPTYQAARAWPISSTDLRAEVAELQAQIVATCGHGRRARLAEARALFEARAEAAEAAEARERAASARQLVGCPACFGSGFGPGRPGHEGACRTCRGSGRVTLPRPGDHLPNGCRVVAVTSGSKGHYVAAETLGRAGHPFATWALDSASWATHWGHYLNDKAEALADLAARSRSLSAAGTPDSLKEGYSNRDGTPARVAPRTASRATLGAAMAADLAALFALRPVPRAPVHLAEVRTAEARARGRSYVGQWGAERAARAIEESLELFADPAEPFESVRDFVEYPEARDVVAWREPGGRWVLAAPARGAN